MTESSIDDLKTRTSSDVSVIPRQFRPNFLVRGSVPYEEDKWEWVKIGETAMFKNVKPCTRFVIDCVIKQKVLNHQEFVQGSGTVYSNFLVGINPVDIPVHN